MKTSTYNATMTFTEPLLGGACNNPDVHAEYIASKAETPAASKEELEAITPTADPGAVMERMKGVFPKDNDGLFLWDYQLRGFFKENLGFLIDIGEIDLSKWIYKRAVQGLVYIYPRRIRLLNKYAKPILNAEEELSRPLRADTLQGPRVALATSEMLPAGTQIRYTIDLILTSNAKSKMKITEEMLEATLAFGSKSGFGQWRSAHFGRYDYQLTKLPEKK